MLLRLPRLQQLYSMRLRLRCGEKNGKKRMREPVPGSKIVVKSCPSKSRASYFRFARFNTSSLYYLRAWHRLGVRRHKKSMSEASRRVGWGAERAADLPPSFPLRRLPTGSPRSPICFVLFFLRLLPRLSKKSFVRL